MTTEEQILERLDRIEAQLAPVSASARGLNELREDLIPLSGQAFRLLIRELEDVESGFQLEDLLALMKRSLRSVKHLQFGLEQLENIVDFVLTIEPLLKSSVPQLINYLDDLEQKGVLRIIQSTLDVRAKVAAAYSADDSCRVSDDQLEVANHSSDHGPHADDGVDTWVGAEPGHEDITQDAERCPGRGPQEQGRGEDAAGVARTERK